jgi:hypothetical protein
VDSGNSEDRGEGAGERRPFLARLGEIPEPAALTKYTLALRPSERPRSPRGDPVDGCQRVERVKVDDTRHASLPVTMAGRPRGPEQATL